MAEHLIDRPFASRRCRACHAWVLAGFDGGIPVEADPVTLDERGELAALLDGRPTFDARLAGACAWPKWRDAEAIKAGRIHPVVAAHRCGRPLAPAPDIPATICEPIPDIPPF